MSEMSRRAKNALAANPVFEHLAEELGRALLLPQACGADPAVLASRSWHVIQTRHNMEYVAVGCVRAAGFPAHLPLFVEPTRSKAGNLAIGTPVIRRLFPGFLFAAFDLDDGRWPRLLTARGVARILNNSAGWPATMPRGEMEELLRRSGPNGYQDDRTAPREDEARPRKRWRNLTSLSEIERVTLLHEALGQSAKAA